MQALTRLDVFKLAQTKDLWTRWASVKVCSYADKAWITVKEILQCRSVC